AGAAIAARAPLVAHAVIDQMIRIGFLGLHVLAWVLRGARDGPWDAAAGGLGGFVTVSRSALGGGPRRRRDVRRRGGCYDSVPGRWSLHGPEVHLHNRGGGLEPWQGHRHLEHRGPPQGEGVLGHGREDRPL